MHILPLRTRGDYLCIDTDLYNALNNAHLHYVWDYANKGLKFDDSEEYAKAVALQKWSEEKCRKEVNIEPIKKVPIKTKKGRLF